jgi:predicted amidohydrolase YtcJ
MMTSNAAFAGFDENVSGRLAVGYHGDAVLLEEDPFSVPLGQLRRDLIEATIVGGRVAYGR